MFNYNFHPVLSSFPLPIIFLAAAAEGALIILKRESLKAASLWLSLAFCASVVAAFFSGYNGADFASKTFLVPENEIAQHHLIGKFLIFGAPLLPILALVRKRAQYGRAGFTWAYRGVLAILFAGVIFAGFLGGRLVFEFGAGVTAMPPAAR